MMSEKVTTTNRVRVVTAASLFDGHDAAINVMRRLIQSMGCEVIHLGHNRSVADVVQAAIEEDAQAVAISSYQGGHMEYFRYMVQLLREQGAGHVKVYGGGGGVIVPEEIRQLHADGVTRIYHPEDGRRLGLVGMIADLVRGADYDVTDHGQQDAEALLAGVKAGDKGALARLITLAEREVESPGALAPSLRAALAGATGAAVIGITGTGGAQKAYGITAVIVLKPTTRL